MTDEARKALVDKVAKAIANYELPMGPGWQDKWMEYRGTASAAIAVALEEAAQVTERLEDEWATVWRTGYKCDTHLEGMSDGASEIAAAIRALISPSCETPSPGVSSGNTPR